MLTVKPDPSNDNNEIKTLNAFNDGEPCGFIRFHHRGYILVIDELLPIIGDPQDIDKDTYAVLDTIIRALGSYGLNHSCYYLECSDPVLYSTLSALRFEQKDGMMKSDLSKILNKCH